MALRFTITQDTIKSFQIVTYNRFEINQDRETDSAKDNQDRDCYIK